MKILVTGGSGFIGRNLVEKLVALGHRVINVDLKEVVFPGAEFIKLDIKNKKSMQKIAQGIDYIYHLVGPADIREMNISPSSFLYEGIFGTGVIAEVALEAKVKRLIYASSVWVYSAASEDNVDENTFCDWTNCHDFYVFYKLSSEALLGYFQKKFELPCTIFRLGIAYGPFAKPQGVIRRFLDNAAKNKDFIIFGDGSQSRAFIYIDDLVEGLIAGIKESASNQIINLTQKEPTTIKELAEIIRDKFNKNINIDYNLKFSDNYSLKNISIDKAKKLLGWAPRISLSEGLQKNYHWLTRNDFSSNTCF